MGTKSQTIVNSHFLNSRYSRTHCNVHLWFLLHPIWITIESTKTIIDRYLAQLSHDFTEYLHYYSFFLEKWCSKYIGTIPRFWHNIWLELYENYGSFLMKQPWKNGGIYYRTSWTSEKMIAILNKYEALCRTLTMMEHFLKKQICNSNRA